MKKIKKKHAYFLRRKNLENEFHSIFNINQIYTEEKNKHIWFRVRLERKVSVPALSSVRHVYICRIIFRWNIYGHVSTQTHTNEI